MYILYLVLPLLAVAWCQQTGDTDSNAKAEEKGTSTTVSQSHDSCRTPDNKVGKCVIYYLCDPKNNTVVTDGANLIDYRKSSLAVAELQEPRRLKRNSDQEPTSSLNEPCANYLETCCLVDHTLTPPVTPKPSVTSNVEGDKLDTPETTKPDISDTKGVGCGWRNPNGVGFVDVKQGNALFGEFPWVVAVLRTEPFDGSDPDGQKLKIYFGGGSLIHPSVVLADAYVVPKGKENGLLISAGEWDSHSKKELYPSQDRDVSSVVVHEDYNSGNLYNNIAVLFLAQPVDLAPNVGVVCLPPPQAVTPAGTRCFAAGWGKDKFGKHGRYQHILKKIEVPVVDDVTCVDKLRQTKLGKYFQLHSSFMCAGGEAGQDTCTGDAGSPLACPIQNISGRYMQTGIVSWGMECGEDGIPGVYTDVAHLRNWIDDKVREKGFDTSIYTI